jgi:hypothetical protein
MKGTNITNDTGEVQNTGQKSRAKNGRYLASKEGILLQARKQRINSKTREKKV